ncbi:unnamed protein product [Caenorhabditis angaria]|uniref:C-type lectin domain-containing protein n=1 Tax=Caenorhabditis angaria TaxID=860376 RepID=A0A9P1IUB4_9PELO|nr:unnamed protein product [Caenorhabditis angaria]
MCAFLFFFCILSLANCYMLIFYGELGTSMNCTKYSTVSWDTCITNCDENDNCFLSYTSLSVSCNTCGFGGFPGISYSPSETNYKLALKSRLANCTYNLEMLSQQKIDALKQCPGGYGTLPRNNAQSSVCFQRLYQQAYTTQDVAKTLCTDRSGGYGGQLMGLDSDQMRSSLSATTITIYLYNCSIWIGLELKNGIWTWTDPWFTGSGSIAWASGHPKTGNTCASLQYGTGLLQSEKMLRGNLHIEILPRFLSVYQAGIIDFSNWRGQELKETCEFSWKTSDYWIFRSKIDLAQNIDGN